MDYRFSVLMPVYCKEKPEYFSEALASVINQTLKPDEIVIVKDGPLTEELDNVLSKYVDENPGLFKIVALAQNEGCGAALALGVNECSYELIARMDSDDISRKDRFEKQIQAFKDNPELDICGSQIIEFELNINNIVSHRIVPLEDSRIKHFQKMRSAFNHTSIIFKKTSILEVGNYQNFSYMEDHILWSKVLEHGVIATNIDEYLVFVRVGKDMFDRRGGFNYFIKYRKGRRYLYESKLINTFEYIFPMFCQYIVAVLPNKLRATVYKQFLHSYKK